MAENSPPRRTSNVVELWPGVRKAAAALPISDASDWFVYEVRPCLEGFEVSFRGAQLTQHPTQAAAVSNAKLMARNMHGLGRRTCVKIIRPDGGFDIASVHG